MSQSPFLLDRKSREIPGRLPEIPPGFSYSAPTAAAGGCSRGRRPNSRPWLRAVAVVPDDLKGRSRRMHSRSRSTLASIIAVLTPAIHSRPCGSVPGSRRTEWVKGGNASQVDQLADHLRGLTRRPGRDEHSDDFALLMPVLVSGDDARMRITAVVEGDEIRVVREEDSTRPWA
jgi:hypothetical protein